MSNETATIDDSDTVESLPTTTLAVSLATAEIDQQIATARARPRRLKRVVDNILSLATLDETSAEECVYALPRSGKAIKGPSVRLAEIVSSQYGNCRVGARVVHVDKFEKFVEAEGVFHDLESNTATTARVRRRISDSKGRLYNDDMIVVTGNAACSIAKRNAILGGVPKAIWRKAYEAVESVIAGDVKTLTERRDKAMKAFAAFGVTPERVFAAIDVSGLDDINLEHMTTLIGMHSALKSGESTVEEMFPVKKSDAPAGDAPKNLKDKLDAAAGVKKDAAAPPHDPETGEIKDPAGEATQQGDAKRSSHAEGHQPSAAHANASHPGAEADTRPSASAADKPKQEPKQQDAKPAAAAAANAKRKSQDDALRADLVKQGGAHATKGIQALRRWLADLNGDEEALINPEIPGWETQAKEADRTGSAKAAQQQHEGNDE